MTDSISFGKKGNTGKIDLTKVKDGLTKAQIAGNDKKLQSIFDKVDSNRNEVLEKDELEAFHKELSELAGDDNELTNKEAKGFKDADGHKMGRRHRKAFYEFLNKLSANEQEPQAVQQPAQELQAPQTDATELVEIPETIQTTVSAQNADEIVNTDDEDTETVSDETLNETVVEPEIAEEEPEPQVTGGIIVQNGESPAVIAKKFGVPLQELLDANQGQLKGKGKNKYFVVGAEIVIPKKYSDEELAALTAGRKSAAEANADYAQQMAIREQRRAQQKAQMEALGVVNRKGAGTVVSTKTKATEDGKFANFSKNPAAYQKMTYTVVGETGNRGRMIVKASNGKYYTMAKDGIILKETYAKATKAYDAGKAQARNDGRGRQVVNVDGQEYIFSQDGKLLKSSHVQITDAKDAGKASKTASGNQTSFVKGQDGKVHYFDKNGQLITGDQRKQLVRAEAEQIADIIYKSAAGMGTDEDKLAQGVNMIYSPEVMAEVNAILKTKHKDYAGTTQTTPLEALLLDELSRSEVRGHINTLAKNGAYGTGEAKDAALGRNAAREIQYEVHGGVFGYTSTKDLNEAMNVASTRGARIETEKHFDGPANDGSKVRQYIADDGWNAQEVDQFDANWVKNGAYDHEHDQAHRNAVTGRLVFEYGNDESLHAGLEAIDPESVDYQYVSTRAAEANKTNGYQAHFNGQDALQTYIAGRATDENGAVETPEVSACNTLLFKGEKPVRIQAEEALYEAKTGNFSNMFDSMDPKVYEEMADMIADGEVTGCKNIKEAYDKALNSATTGNDRTKIKANAILSGQIDFSDAEIADFCVELMHSIDSNQGAGASTGVSAKHTNTADYMTAQLEAILQANPNVIATVREKVQNEKFESTSSTIHAGGSFGGGNVNITTKDNKDKYLAIINNSKHVANEAVFYDKDGNQITNPEEIAALTNANMQALQGMREYVAQLERDFKKGVDAEGNLSNMANDILTYSGLGTDRDDVATQYRNAKIMLAQLEAAAQGKLRDSEGNVISVQDLAQKITETQDKLAQTNSDYQSSMQMTRMGIVLAPVIAVTTVASGGAAAAGWGTLATAGTAGLTTGITTYGLNAYEYSTSLTGNTAEAREQNAIDSTVAGVSTFIGAAQMGPVSKLFNNANAFVRGGGRLTTVLASDVGVGAAGEYVQTGTVTVNGVAMNAIFSATGNFIGIKSLAKKAEIPTNTPHVEINNHPSHDAEVVNNALHNEHVEADHHAGYARKRQQEADKLAVDMDPEQSVVTPEQQAAYDKEIAYQPVPEADRPAFEAHQQQVARDYAEAHELGNMVDASSAAALQRAKANIEAGADAPAVPPEAPAAPAPKAANQEAIERLTQSIEDLDRQIARAEHNMKSAASRGKRVTPQQEQQLARMKENRAAKQAELDALQKPASEPEVVVKADDSVEAEVVAKPEEQAVVTSDDIEVISVEAPEVVFDKSNLPPVVKSPYGDFTPVTSRQEAEDVFNRLVTDRCGDFSDIDNPKPQKGAVFYDLGRAYWLESAHRVEQGTKWKIHLYANSAEEWANVAQIALPYLEKNNSLGFKTVRDFDKLEGLRHSQKYGDGQTGKAFTVYFEDEAAFLKAADELGTLFDNSGLRSSGHVKNEAQIGESGFVSYRNELEARTSSDYKPAGMEDPYLKAQAEKKSTPQTENAQVAVEPEIVSGGKAEPVVRPEEVQTPENIVRDAQAIPAAEIPAEHRSMWKSCQEKINKILSGAGELAMGEVKTVLSDLKTLYNAVKNVKVRTQIARLSKRIQAYAKSKLTSKPASVDAGNRTSRPNKPVEVSANSVGNNPRLNRYTRSARNGQQAVITPKTYKQIDDYLENLYKQEYRQLKAWNDKNGNVYSENQLRMEARTNAESQRPTTPDEIEHFAWIQERKDLFKGMDDWDCWSAFTPKDQHHGPWKMHMFSVNEQDWRDMCDVIVPYLRENGIEWKTFNAVSTADCLNGGIQQGKAFTIYPRDNAHMEQVARELDYIIRNNQLNTTGTNITGDRALGDNGRLFYRYEFNSGKYKNEILDLGNKADYAKYHERYDRNRGEGRYLASDMTAADDPWLNFDPSNPNSKPGQTAPTPEAPAAAPRGLSPEQKAAVGEIGDMINRAKNNHSIDQAQAKIDRLPDSPEKRTLQRQANEKSRELRRSEEPIEGRHKQEPYFVDVSDQADIIAEPIRIDNDNSIDLVLPNKNGEYNISVKDINNKIETASTELDLDSVQKRINQIEDCPEKFELQRKLDRKRQELNENNIVMVDELEANSTSGNKNNNVDDAAVLYDDFNEYNSFDDGLDIADDMGGFDPF